MNALAIRRRVAPRAVGACPLAKANEASPTLWEQTRPMMIADFRTIMQATETLVASPRYSASGLGLTDQETQDAKNVLTAAGVLLVARGLAGWYIGSKMGRATSGAVIGSIFGPLGRGVLSFWRK